MKLSHFFAGALIFSTAACGQFSEFSVNVSTLAGDELTTGLFIINGNNQNRNIEIIDIRVNFAQVILNGDEFNNELLVDTEINLAADGDDDDALLDEVFDADKAFNQLVVVIDEVEVAFEIDRDGLNGDNEAEGVVLLENLDIELVFDNFEFDSVKQNVVVLLELSAKDIVAGIDFQDANVVAFDAAANTFFIDEDNNPVAADLALDNVENLNFVKGNYVLNVQDARVKP
jgi:hypothetical protein